MSYFGKLVTELGSRFPSFDVTKDPDKSKVERAINASARWIYTSHPWEWRPKTGQVTLIPNYTTGTCTVTQFTGTNEAAARTVTFSTALPSNIQSRYIKVDDGNSWHKILYASGSTAYLETPVTDKSGGGLAFKIWKRFYYLPGDVASITDFGRWDNRYGRMEYKSFSNLVDQKADVSEDGTPSDFTPFGVDNFETVYSTGTISGGVDSNLITGEGAAAWLGNVLSGDLLIVSEKIFSVKRNETDTRIILNNYLPEAIPASSTYEIRRNLSVGFQFYPNNITDYMTVPFYYLDRMFDMVHYTKDRPNLPDDFDDAILTRAEYKLKKNIGAQDWVLIRQDYSTEMDKLKRDYRVVRPRYDIFAPEVRGYPGRG